MYALRIETRSPSGAGMEWTHSHGWSDKEQAQQEADFGNKYFPAETMYGVEHSLYWFVEKEGE